MVLTSSDLAQMRGDLTLVRDDNPASIIIRRGEATLPAQSVRVARLSAAGERQSLAGQEARGKVVVLGATTDALYMLNIIGVGRVGQAYVGGAAPAWLDIQPGDRFTHAGVLYRVTFIRPNVDAGVMAEAEAVE